MSDQPKPPHLEGTSTHENLGMKLDRRAFFKITALAGAGAVGQACASAQTEDSTKSDKLRMGVLVDTTACIGCRNCEYACQQAHDLPTQSLQSYGDPSVFEKLRRPDTTALTVVNRFDPQGEIQHQGKSQPQGESLHQGKSQPKPKVKVQCMHCEHPACVSVCIVGALTKKENGPVVWDSDMCIGCRYCMVACPFQVPSFEYEKALHPRIMKCDFCNERQEMGKLPACVDICPVEALTFGPRDELLSIARQRVRRSPDRYVNHFYGEHEVGGTDWIYMAGFDFSALAFPVLGKAPAPGVSESIQHGIFAYFFPPVMLYSLLGILMWSSSHQPTGEEEEHK